MRHEQRIDVLDAAIAEPTEFFEPVESVESGRQSRRHR
jgi:hypothetical protein